MQAALVVLDAVGLDGLTMRRLADQLGVKAASLYWHVRDKGELLGLLAEVMCAEVRAPAPDLPWRAQLEALAWENRRVLLAHRDAAQILASTLPTGPNRLRLIELGLRILQEAGFTGQALAYAAHLLNDYTTLLVAEETIYAPAAAQDASVPEMAADMRSQFAALSPDLYPHMVALADLLTGSAEERFGFGLEVLLDGLAQRLGRERDA